MTVYLSVIKWGKISRTDFNEISHKIIYHYRITYFLFDEFLYFKNDGPFSDVTTRQDYKITMLYDIYSNLHGNYYKTFLN